METPGPCRKALRWKLWDYSTPGDYFVTICKSRKAPLFGMVAHGRMILNEAGKMVQRVWEHFPAYCPGMESGEAVVMLDHLFVSGGLEHILKKCSRFFLTEPTELTEENKSSRLF